jgi:hypothetical protein
MNDDELRDRLGRIDPAAGLPPLGAAERTALLDRASAASERTPRRVRPGLRILVGAAIGVAAAGLFLAVLPRPAIQTNEGRLLTLSVPDDRTAMCMPVADFAAEALAASTIAFSGTVDSVDGDRVTVAVDDQYRGDPVGEAVLDVPAKVEDPTILPAGARVLIAAQDGVVTGCGLSGEASPELQALYDAAF